jgi:hypothetical protein
MHDLHRDVSRLVLISQVHIGQERLSIATYFHEFTRYYFQRFLINLQHSFKNFAGTELGDFNRRHVNQIKELTKYPALSNGKVIVPIPKGMVQSYKVTLEVLTAVLEKIDYLTVEQDLHRILVGMNQPQLQGVSIDDLDKQTYDTARDRIGHLFGKTGLSYATAQQALVSSTDIAYVNEHLQGVITKLYAVVLAINPLLKQIEARFSAVTLSDRDKDILSGYLMTMAYRVSILAVAADHLQSLEHGFVASLQTLIKHEK